MNIKHTTGTRLALIALVGEEEQRQMIEAFNERLEDDTQIPVITPWNSEDFDNHLKDLFCYWFAKEVIDFNLHSAFDSILRIAGYKDPKQTIQAWIWELQEQVADTLKKSISELDFSDCLVIDLSVELDQLDVEESFFRFYAHSRNEADRLMRIKLIAGTRLALIALVGVEQQKQIFNSLKERLES